MIYILRHFPFIIWFISLFKLFTVITAPFQKLPTWWYKTRKYDFLGHYWSKQIWVISIFQNIIYKMCHGYYCRSWLRTDVCNCASADLLLLPHGNNSILLYSILCFGTSLVNLWPELDRLLQFYKTRQSNYVSESHRIKKLFWAIFLVSNSVNNN